jgi:O-acetyl-ADP-ribose deacetylase (regulator of RNase III)
MSSARTIERPWSWGLGPVLLEVRAANLLRSPHAAWVNSEQTDFVLARGEPSVSAQLNARWPRMQAELDEQTRRAVLRAGTVLHTSGPGRRVVFHAGFHEPDAWLEGGEDKEAFFLDAIRECVDRILDDAAVLGLPSVAFPLIGSGRFGLPGERVAEVFFDSVVYFARRAVRPLQVTLCVRRRQDVPRLVQAGTKMFAKRVAGGEPLVSGNGGHPLVRDLRARVRAQADTALGDLLAFAEFGLTTDLAHVADDGGFTIDEVLGACTARSRSCRLTFGLVFDRLHFLAARTKRPAAPRVRERLAFLAAPPAQEALRRLVDDRNDYAHLRSPRAIPDIVRDVDSLFGAAALPHEWPEHEGTWLRRIDGEPALLHAVDFAHHKRTWLSPLTRVHRTEPAGNDGIVG